MGPGGGLCAVALRIIIHAGCGPRRRLDLAGRGIAYQLARIGKQWRDAAAVRMPEARGDIREIVGQPVFVPLQKLFLIYGKARLQGKHGVHSLQLKL